MILYYFHNENQTNALKLLSYHKSISKNLSVNIGFGPLLKYLENQLFLHVLKKELTINIKW